MTRAAAAFLVLLAACSDDDPLGVWTACDLDGAKAECLRLERPLPSGQGLVVFVQRFPAPQPATGQLWLLQGGPGGSGASLQRLALALHEAGVAMDIYLPDHRGTGASTRLDCPRSFGRSDLTTVAGLFEACGAELRDQWGDDLAAFSTSEAADDLAAQIDFAADGLPVIVWGGSYGTFWAHRHLQRHPGQAAGVVLDSVCAGRSCELAAADRNVEAGAHQLLDECTADEACRAKLGDAWAAVQDLSARVSAGHCPALGGRERLRGRLAQVAMIAPPLLAPFVFRMSRCAAGDLEVLAALDAALASGEDPGFSLPLQLHVLLSELWPDTSPPLAEEQAWGAASVANSQIVPAWIAAHDRWPRYPSPAEADLIADTATPVLVLSGTRDWQTPPALADEIAAALRHPHQRQVVIPYGGHGLLLHSPCATRITLAFFADPQGALDTSCVEAIQAPEVDETQLAPRFFGRRDPWD